MKENNDVASKYVSSRLVVFCSCLLDNQKNSTGWKWGHKHNDLLRQSKQHLITGSNKHSGYSGKYYSFGNKESYTMIYDVSVGQYEIKKIRTR